MPLTAARKTTVLSICLADLFLATLNEQGLPRWLRG